MTTYESKSEHIERIRDGDLEAIREWMATRSQEDYAVEKLAVESLFFRIDRYMKAEEHSREGLIHKLALMESALNTVEVFLHNDVGPAMLIHVGAPSPDCPPQLKGRVYEAEAIDFLCDFVIPEAKEMSPQEAHDFLMDCRARINERTVRATKSRLVRDASNTIDKALLKDAMETLKKRKVKKEKP